MLLVNDSLDINHYVFYHTEVIGRSRRRRQRHCCSSCGKSKGLGGYVRRRWLLEHSLCRHQQLHLAVFLLPLSSLEEASWGSPGHLRLLALHRHRLAHSPRALTHKVIEAIS